MVSSVLDVRGTREVLGLYAECLAMILASICLLLILPSSLRGRTGPLRGRLVHQDAGQPVLELDSPKVKVPLSGASSLVSTGYTLWLRNGAGVTANRSLALPTCLYTGSIVNRELELHAALSACDGAVQGTVDIDGVQFKLASQE